MPGPKHPATKYYELRQKNKKNFIDNGATYNKKSNPQKADKKRREKTRAKCKYEMAQYMYYNRRRKIVHEILKPINSASCKIEMNFLESHFSNVFETENNNLKESYESDRTYDSKDDDITIEEVSESNPKNSKLKR